MATTPDALTAPPAPPEPPAAPARSWPHALGLVVFAIASIAAAVSPMPELALLVGAIGVLVALRNVSLSNRVVLGAIAAMIAVVPVRRYELPLDLPYRLEPYRILLLVIATMLALTLAVDPRIRLRRLGFGGWVAAFVATSILSVAPNLDAIRALGADDRVIGDAAALLTAALAYVVVRLLLRRKVDVHGLIGTFVVCGAFVGLTSIIERRSGWNAIRLLDNVLPVGVEDRDLEQVGGAIKFGRARAFGSSQHPIALGAELAILLPLAVYLLRHSRWPATQRVRTFFWGACGLLMFGGIAASVSRTAIVALLVTVLFAWRLRPVVVHKLLPIALTAGIVLALVGGGAVGDLIETFKPEGGLIAEQTQHKSARRSGRLDDVERVTEILRESPFVGVGMSTRGASENDASRLILDNAYFSRLVDTGVLGFVPFLGLLFVPMRRMARLARSNLPDPAIPDLAAALACGLMAFAVGAFFYDAFAFYQVVLTLMAFVAVAGWLVTDVVPSVEEREPTAEPVAQ